MRDPFTQSRGFLPFKLESIKQTQDEYMFLVHTPQHGDVYLLIDEKATPEQARSFFQHSL
jgi:hypothetical protein